MEKWNRATADKGNKPNFVNCVNSVKGVLDPEERKGGNKEMFHITLRAIRESCGYTIDEAAKHCGISAQEMAKYEKNPGEMMCSTAMKIRRLYPVPLDFIYAGTEEDCAKRNRELARAENMERAKKAAVG